MKKEVGVNTQPEVISSKGQDIAMVLRGSAWNEGLQIHTSEREFVQVGTWIYSEGTVLRAHAHRECPRVANRTQEVVHVLSGRVLANIFDADDVCVAECELGPTDTLIVLGGGHGYRILQDGTRVLEVKNGPYPGIEKDKRLLQATGN